MSLLQGAEPGRAARPEWYPTISPFQQPRLQAAIWQLANTFIPYVVSWASMVRTTRVRGPYWMVLAMAVVASGLHLRIFSFSTTAVTAVSLHHGERTGSWDTCAGS